MHIYVFHKKLINADPYVRDMFTLDHDLDMLNVIQTRGYAYGRLDLIYIDLDYEGVKSGMYNQYFNDFYIPHSLKLFIDKLN
jgi:hypothetical protein